MKNIILFACFLICCIDLAKAKERIIVCPPITACSSTSIEIAKITISDTATVVDIKAFYRPKNWIRIASESVLKDNKGVTYPIIKGIGITLDKEFWMPESGEAEFQLIFPPLPETATSIDFSEGDSNGAYKIWGIQLSGKPFPLPKEAVLPKINPKATLPEPTFTYGKTVLNGKILDYNTEIANNSYLNFISPFRTLNGGLEIKINKDGTFHMEMDIPTLSVAKLYIPQLGSFNLYLVPEKEISIIINTREITRQDSQLHENDKPYGEKVYYSGYLAGILQELSRSKIKADLFENCDKLRAAAKEENFTKLKNNILQKRQNILNQINKSSSSPALKEILKANIDISTIGVLDMADKFIKDAHCTYNKLSEKESREYYQKTVLTIPDNYFESLNKVFNINNNKILYTTAELAPLYLEENVQKILGIDKGVIADIKKASKYCRFIDDFIPLTAEQKAELSSLPTSYAQMIRQKNNDLLKKIELNKQKAEFKINEVGQVSNENLFSSIISKYGGKTLLIDFWATWCGPCRMANKDMISMKEELKDKSIVYIYITGENSPKKTWENMITDIHGEHFRLTAGQWKYLSDFFKIEGVPTYLVIDREGNITFKHVGFPGVSKMKEELMKAINK